MATEKLPVRLALRIEGEWWVAYLAQADTMEGAHRLGSILMGAIRGKPERKEAFMDLMQSSVIGDAIEEVYGLEPGWTEPQAPAERAGQDR